MSQEQLANPSNLAIERFRILIIGNANAGKTTILEKVCHAKGRKPVYLDDKGNEIADSELKASASRGEHEIEHQFQYPTAHGFVFHDSRGFEAGGAIDLKRVKDFIENRAKGKQLKDQLHVIWYCLPTSNDRGMTKAEMSLFESGTGNVPVIAIFTKMDALDHQAFEELLDGGVPVAEAKMQARARGEDIFETNYRQRLEKVNHKPRSVVRLRDMNKEDTDCDELIISTSKVLDGKTLKLFCLSFLRNDVESRIKEAINQIIIPKAEEARKSGSFSDEQAKSLFCDLMYCFPHMLPSFDKLINDMDKNAVNAMRESVDIRALSLDLDDLHLHDRFHARLLDRFHFFHDLRGHENRYLQQCLETLLAFMPQQTSYRPIWIGLMTEAIADFCLFTSLSSTHENFQKAFDFCHNAPSYSRLTLTMEEEFSITHANVVLDILEENRHNYMLSQQ
jgi:GTP-binding protein EngB required for normal cell division